MGTAFTSLGEEVRWVLMGLDLKRRAANSPTNWPEKDRMRANAPGLVREEARKGPRFTLAGVKGRCGKSRD